VNDGPLTDPPRLFAFLEEAETTCLIEGGEWVPCVGVEQSHFFVAGRFVQWNGISGWRHTAATALYIFELPVTASEQFDPSK
jgi:hypothetical protein